MILWRLLNTFIDLFHSQLKYLLVTKSSMSRPIWSLQTLTRATSGRRAPSEIVFRLRNSVSSVRGITGCACFPPYPSGIAPLPPPPPPPPGGPGGGGDGPPGGKCLIYYLKSWSIHYESFSFQLYFRFQFHQYIYISIHLSSPVFIQTFHSDN